MLLMERVYQRFLPESLPRLMRFLSSLVLIIFLFGCRSFHPRLYSGPVPPMPLDTGCLSGIRIVLDPGHGGEFSGAVGPRGLLEKDVNLDVALQLRDYLRAGGAEVVLTREGDYRCGGEEGGPLISDLAARRRLAWDFNPLLFISIHHNGGPTGVNRVETYYKLGNEGASLDLARFIHRRLIECTGIEENFIRAGNYRFMRDNPAICVLLEAAYLTDEEIERVLEDPEAKKREAYFIFLGIVDYVSLGIPRAEYLEPFIVDPVSTIAVRIGRDIDTDTIDVKVDDRYPAFHYDDGSGTVYYHPASPLPAGIHTISIFARNRGGNALWRGVSQFKVESEPRDAVCYPLSSVPLGREACFSAYLVDRFGNPVGGEIDVSVQDGRLSRAYNPISRRFYAVADSADFSVKLEWEGGEKSLSFDASPADGERALFVVDSVSGEGIAVCVVEVGSAYRGETNEDGYAMVSVSEGDEVKLLADGYEEMKLDGGMLDGPSQLVHMDPVYDSLLLGRKFFIDPQGRFTNEPIAEIDDFRSNLATAQRLRGLLEKGGARCILSLRAVSNSEKLRAIEEFTPSIFISIGRSNSPSMRYCSGSRKGEQLAASIRRCSPSTLEVVESDEYLLVQTSMVAIEALFPGGKAASHEKEAETLFNGILKYLSGTDR